jgi:general secretion pathway protein B
VSYILEALKKAEAQRGQGQVPGLHDQHMAPEFSGGGAREGNGLLIWIIMAMGLIMMGLLVWALWQPDAAPPPSLPAIATAPAPAPAPAPTQAVMPKAPPEAIAPPTPAIPPQAPLAATEPTPAPAQAMVEPALQPRHERRVRNEPAKADAAPAAKAQQDTLPELPESMRAQLPKLSFGGAMHSDNPASRMLIVNGQLLHEGDAISPDLTLEQIQLKQATFRFKGHRYTAQY